MSLDCPFCADEIKERAIFEGDYTMVVLSNPRLVYGHLLIIPKRHVLKYSELKENEVLEIFSLLAKYQEKVLLNLSKGTEVRQNHIPHKENSRTHVNHFHFNLLPRDVEDVFSQKVDIHIRKLYEELSEVERKRVSEVLNH